MYRMLPNCMPAKMNFLIRSSLIVSRSDEEFALHEEEPYRLKIYNPGMGAYLGCKKYVNR